MINLEQTTTWQLSYQPVKALTGGEDDTAYFYFKRFLDVTIATLLLLLLIPLIALIAILIKLDSPGPIFFVLVRVGARRRQSRYGQPIWEIQTFRFYKFRS
ncbi:MAG: hypothetical protein GY832_36805, partial [Chloroflexi bacterium]|nr:hypothetical protein [Chloroflexota bacterium]